jgi:hypothetical protein
MCPIEDWPAASLAWNRISKSLDPIVVKPAELFNAGKAKTTAPAVINRPTERCSVDRLIAVKGPATMCTLHSMLRNE